MTVCHVVLFSTRRKTLTYYKNVQYYNIKFLVYKQNVIYWNVIIRDSKFEIKLLYWRSKFNKSAQCGQVDECVDAEGIADRFVSHFRTAFTCNNAERADSLKAQYLASRVNYALSDEQNFDIELVSNIILSLKCGKAAGGDG